MSDKRRKLTPEFRAEAVKSVTDPGRPVAQVAAEIGVGAQLLGRWLKLSQPAGVDAENAHTGGGFRKGQAREALPCSPGRPTNSVGHAGLDLADFGVMNDAVEFVHVIQIHGKRRWLGNRYRAVLLAPPMWGFEGFLGTGKT